jgi:hypothetical protein
VVLEVVCATQMMENGTPLVVSQLPSLWNNVDASAAIAAVLSELLEQNNVTDYTFVLSFICSAPAVTHSVLSCFYSIQRMMSGPETLLCQLAQHIEIKQHLKLNFDARMRLHKCTKISDESTLAAARVEHVRLGQKYILNTYYSDNNLFYRTKPRRSSKETLKTPITFWHLRNI